MSSSTDNQQQQHQEDSNKAMENNEEVMDTSEVANGGGANNEDDRKLFVGGLPQDAKEADIKEHFGKFGEIEGVNLKTDPVTGRSRGFAFIVFKELEGVDKAVGAADGHTIKGKKVAVKKAQAKQGKIYVGKLKPELSDEEIKEFFSKHGAIAAVEQPFDKAKNERKNFCFITFEREETAKKLLKEGSVTVKGHELEIKKVTPKPGNMMMGGAGPAGMSGFGGGRGGGRGGGQGGPGNWSFGPQWGGYGEYWGGYGGFGGGAGAGAGGDPYGYGGGNWGYGGAGNGGWGGFGGPAGGKTPRGGPRGGGGAGAGVRGRGAGAGAGRGQRQKPY